MVPYWKPSGFRIEGQILRGSRSIQVRPEREEVTFLVFSSCSLAQARTLKRWFSKAINAIVVQVDAGLKARTPIIRRATCIELRIKRDQALEIEDFEPDLDRVIQRTISTGIDTGFDVNLAVPSGQFTRQHPEGNLKARERLISLPIIVHIRIEGHVKFRVRQFRYIVEIKGGQVDVLTV